MKSTDLLIKLVDCIDNGLQATQTPPFVVPKGHIYYNYILKLEKQGYLTVNKTKEGSLICFVTVEGIDHITEIRGV